MPTSVGDAMKSLTEPLNKLLVPPASAIGSTLQDVWELVFGGFGTYVDKKRAQRLHNLTEFKESLESKVAAIPEDQLCEPALAIVGPALEASKYYFEEPELREMFANLISASMDSAKVSSVQPCFTEIIKQLTPLDAQNLTCLRNAEYKSFPLAEYRRVGKEDSRFAILFTNVFLSNPLERSVTKQAISITSLSRFGLVETSYMSRFADDSYYQAFYETEEYRSLLDTISKDPANELHVNRGQIHLTPLGEAFISVCLPDGQA